MSALSGTFAAWGVFVLVVGVLWVALISRRSDDDE